MNKKLTRFVVIRLDKTPANKKRAKSSGSCSAKVNAKCSARNEKDLISIAMSH